MNIDVNGKRVVVAGGSRGIGRSIALAFAQGGAKVSICARGAASLEATRNELMAAGTFAHAEACDLSREADIARYVPNAAAALGGIDVLVNNATAGAVGDEEAAWEESLAVDLMAVVRASRAALPFLLEGRDPTIINISSGSGLNPSVRTPAYGAAKGAVIHYTRTQAATLAARGIRVNCIVPNRSGSPVGYDDDVTGSRTFQNLAGRLGTADDQAKAALFLVSDDSSFIIGHPLIVDGGVMATANFPREQFQK